jgi:serine/threonine protein kinase/tetratricopeptide (TPR) repeat protein
MQTENKSEEAIFNAAVDIESAGERAAFVKSSCGDDGALLARVEALLQVYYEDGNFLKSPPGIDVTLDDSPLAEGPGTKIGRYKLLQLIGEGGFGVVYMAQQEKPIRRRVALKIIKLGMDTKQVIARFEAERQALAMMEHHNIAKVLDAGATDTGRPYFVMELVRGVAVTEYCDKNNLATQQRLELFIEVCRAVQHAHQKGIIHRDIKPSNVMITLRDDGTGVPKIIDFGIAKATQQRLTEKTLFTEYHQFIGTPEYMSPEQAQMGEVDVDTRTDVYSLGVLFYELLTGTTPFEHKELVSTSYDEMRRIIRETDPPTPSTRLNTLGDALGDIARHRHAEPAELCKIVRGDLDWVVMKTLEKDRSHRYETANELAMDVQRYLGDEPVMAGPPSTVYRLRKFVRRHRTSVVFGLSVAAALIIGLCLATIGFVQASLEKERTQKALAQVGKNFQMARDAVDEMTRVAQEELAGVPRTEKVRRGLLEKAQFFYAGFAQKNRDNPAVYAERALAYRKVGIIHNELGNYSQAAEAFAEAIALLEMLTAEFGEVPEYHVELATEWGWYARTFIWTDRPQEMVRAHTKQVSLWEELVADLPIERAYREGLATAHTDLGNALVVKRRLEEAETHFREALAVWQELHTDFPEAPKNLEGLAGSHQWLGAVLLESGRFAEAEKELLPALQTREQLLAEDPNSPQQRGRLAHLKCSVGGLLRVQGRPEEAEREIREAIAIRSKLLAEFPNQVEHRRRLGWALTYLSQVLTDTGRTEEAEEVVRQLISVREKLAVDFPGVAAFRRNWTGALHLLNGRLRKTGRWAEALEGSREVVDILEKLVADFPEVHENRQSLANNYGMLGAVLRETGRWEEAEQAYQQKQAIEEDLVLLLQKLVAESPTEPTYRQELANAHWCIGGTLLTTHNPTHNRPKEAETHYRQALAIWEELHADFPEAQLNLKGVVDSRTWLGILLTETGRYAEAEQEFLPALQMRQQLLAEDPNSQHKRERLTFTKLHIARLHLEQGKYEEAERQLRGVIAIREELLAEFPSQVDHRRILGQALHALSVALAGTGRTEEAEEVLRQAVSAREKLAADFPDVAGFRRDWEGAIHLLNKRLTETGRWAEALESSREVVEILEKLVADFPDVPDHHRFLANNYRMLGAVLRNTRQLEEAEAAYQEAQAIDEYLVSQLQKLVATLPTVPAYREQLANAHTDLGRMIQQSRPDQAETHLREALALWGQLSTDFPEVPTNLEGLANGHAWLGVLLRETGRLDEALESLRAALQIFEEFVPDFPGIPRYRKSLAMNYRRLADVLRDMDRLEQAEAVYQQVKEIEEEVVHEEQQ